MLEVGEACDDGNIVDGDGCDDSCEVEYCGDGVLQHTTETCDDGNTLSEDGCSSTCVIEACGDSIVQI